MAFKEGSTNLATVISVLIFVHFIGLFPPLCSHVPGSNPTPSHKLKIVSHTFKETQTGGHKSSMSVQVDRTNWSQLREHSG